MMIRILVNSNAAKVAARCSTLNPEKSGNVATGFPVVRKIEG